MFVFLNQVAGEEIGVLPNLVINHFRTIAELKNNQSLSHRFSIIPLVAVNRLLAKISQKAADEEKSNKPKLNFLETASIITKLQTFRGKVVNKSQRNMLKKSTEYKMEKENLEKVAMELSPKCENRVICITSQEVLIFFFLLISLFKVNLFIFNIQALSKTTGR